MPNKNNILKFLIVVLFFSSIAVATETTWRHSGFEISGYDINGSSTHNLTEIRKIEFGWNTSIPAVSETSRAVMYYDDNQKRIMQSLNGGAYQAIIDNTTVNAYTVNAANLTGIAPNASIPLSAANLSANNIFTGTGDTSFTGNVGIGTTAPLARLQVDGTVRVRNRDQGDNIADFRMMPGPGDTETHLYHYNVDGRFGIHKYGTGSPGGEVFTVLNNGNVGIGNTTPANKLAFAVGSATDPIADSWLQYSTPETKIVLGEADNLTEKYRADFRKTTVYRWKRTANEPERLGVLAKAGTPPEILAFHDGKNNTNSTALNATPQGIDLGAYIGWLHEVVKGQDMQLQKQEQQIMELEARVQKLEDRDIMFTKQINYLYNYFNLTKP